jgi:hypothetical protein
MDRGPDPGTSVLPQSACSTSHNCPKTHYLSHPTSQSSSLCVKAPANHCPTFPKYQQLL